MGDAYRMIQYGDVNVMIAGASESCLDPVSFAGFARAKALCTREDIGSRPFDKQRDGFVMGEGAGIVILEELEHAKKRNAKIYAEVVGYALSGDAFHITSPSDEVDKSAAVRVMKSVLKQANISPDQVQYINAHATSTPMGDRLEYQAIQHVFAEQPNSTKLFVNSIKGNIGHLLGAAGAVEAIATILALHHQEIPGTHKFEELDADLTEKKMMRPIEVVENNRVVKIRLQHAISNSFGFGGTNACLLIKANI